MPLPGLIVPSHLNPPLDSVIGKQVYSKVFPFCKGIISTLVDGRAADENRTYLYNAILDLSFKNSSKLPDTASTVIVVSAKYSD